jgi:phosphopantetheine adenylyltransferase
MHGSFLLSPRLTPCLFYLHSRVKLVPIEDAFGPPGQPDVYFDALVLSHETLGTGHLLNEHRQSQGMEPLTLLCTRRTEPHGMSSTAMRRRRWQQQNQRRERQES